MIHLLFYRAALKPCCNSGNVRMIMIKTQPIQTTLRVIVSLFDVVNTKPFNFLGGRMMKKAVVVLALIAVTGIASANILTNASFENATEDAYGALVPDNWNVWSNDWDGTWNQITNGTAADGLAQWSLVSNKVGTTVVGSQQAYVSGVGEKATLSFMVRNDGLTDAVIEIGADYGPTDFTGWWGDDHGGGGVIAAGSGWQLVSYTWLLWDGVGVSPKIAVLNGGQVSVDDANFTVVPEPATMALLGLGALLLRRRK